MERCQIVLFPPSLISSTFINWNSLVKRKCSFFLPLCIYFTQLFISARTHEHLSSSLLRVIIHSYYYLLYYSKLSVGHGNKPDSFLKSHHSLMVETANQRLSEDILSRKQIQKPTGSHRYVIFDYSWSFRRSDSREMSRCFPARTGWAGQVKEVAAAEASMCNSLGTAEEQGVPSGWRKRVCTWDRAGQDVNLEREKQGPNPRVGGGPRCLTPGWRRHCRWEAIDRAQVAESHVWFSEF